MATTSLEAMDACDELKQVRVKIPVRQHIQLHSLRLLTDRTISEIVRDALDRWFEELPDDPLKLDGDGSIPRP